MRNKDQHCSLPVIGQRLSRMPNREKAVAALLAIFLAVVAASSFAGLQTGILVYLAVILTLLASLIHRYAKATDAMARATVNLRKTSRRETLLSMARTITEEDNIFNEILEELREAQKAPRPPFELSAWECNSAKLESMKEWSDVDIDAISSCYKHLIKQNMELRHWQELQQRLEGLVNSQKRRSVVMTLKALEHENLSVIRPALATLVGRLKS